MKKINCCLMPIIALFISTETAIADSISALSARHSISGVSQFWAGSTRDNNSSPMIHIANPTAHEQVVAGLFYNRSKIEINSGDAFGDDPTEKFLCCTLEILTPHGSNRLNDCQIEETGGNVEDDRFHAEIISAPIVPVAVPGKGNQTIADGLGIISRGHRGNAEFLYPLNPTAFTLPDNNKFPGQLEAARGCICSQLFLLKTLKNDQISFSSFEDYGIECPEF